jgi:hypothetical protein
MHWPRLGQGKGWDRLPEAVLFWDLTPRVQGFPMKPGLLGCREGIFVSVGGENIFYLAVCWLGL